MIDVTLPIAEFWFSVSNIALLVGALIVAAGTYGVFTMGAVKERFADERISANEMETERAKESAAQADARAAEANASAETERLARLQLEAKLAPRQLTKEQRVAFIAALSKFKGMAADIAVYPHGTSDIGSLQLTISNALNDSGWTIREWNMLSTETVIGVGVATRAGSDANTELAANSLVSTLNAMGILGARVASLTSNAFPIPAVGPPPVGEIAPIRICIGTKPP